MVKRVTIAKRNQTILQGNSAMSEALASILDLPTAWGRMKRDITDRVFIRHPYAAEVIESDLNGWLDARLEEIIKDEYHPQPMFVCDVPKGGALIRPGSHLSFRDRLIYAACLGACFPHIHKTLSWSQGVVDFSYRLAVDSRNPEWIRRKFTGWQDFRQKSIELIDKGASYVVVADITAFYENIDIGILLSDLRQIGAPQPAVDQISACLNKWAQVPGRGIPQGQSASDILAKLYLNNVDQNLRWMGVTHLRYVDDIRVFCTTLLEAKKILVDLSRLLRRRGLNLQSAKSKILRADIAREKFEDVTAVLRSVRNRFISEVVKHSGGTDPYIELHEAEQILEGSDDDEPVEVIRQAYQTFFIDSADEFNASLFRFLLRRLQKQSDDFAADHCIGLLEQHPEETGTILRYLGGVQGTEVAEWVIVDLIRSGHIFYPYQRYLIMEWLYECAPEITDRTLDLVRETAFDSSSPRFLKTACRALLGKFGTAADLERVADSYDEITDPSEQVEVICALKRLEKGRRNAFFGRVEDESEMHSRAVRWVKSTE